MKDFICVGDYFVSDYTAFPGTYRCVRVEAGLTAAEATIIYALVDGTQYWFEEDACRRVPEPKPTLAEKEAAANAADPWRRNRDENLREVFSIPPRSNPVVKPSPSEVRYVGDDVPGTTEEWTLDSEGRSVIRRI